VRFGPWHALSDAGAAAPETPGVLQLRAAQVIVYPTGKSAMLLYACTAPTVTLRALAAGDAEETLRQAGSAGGRWIRFGPSVTPREDHARLLARFAERFGAFPLLNNLVNHGANAQ